MFLIRWIVGMPMAALITAGLFFMMAQLIKDQNEAYGDPVPDRDFKITADPPKEDPYSVDPPSTTIPKEQPEVIIDFPKSKRPPTGIGEVPITAPTPTTPPGQKVVSGPAIIVPPPYPEGCRSRGIEGSVTVEFDVTPEGNVVNPRVVSAPHSCFRRAVIKAVSGWKYPPAANGGMRYGVIEHFSFQLEQ